MLLIHRTRIEHLSPCCHRCMSTPSFNNSSFSPLVDLHHSRCMNRLGTPQCSDACIEFVCTCSKSGLSATVLRISCLIAAIVASRFSRFETVPSSVNDRRAGCLLLNLCRACSLIHSRQSLICSFVTHSRSS